MAKSYNAQTHTGVTKPHGKYRCEDILGHRRGIAARRGDRLYSA